MGMSTRSIIEEYIAPAIRIWRGEEKLSKAFWIYGVFVSAVLILRYMLARYEGRTALQQILILGFGAFTIWILVSLWRCASKTGTSWGLFTQLLIVPWAVNTAMVLGFLQLDLIAMYLRP